MLHEGAWKVVATHIDALRQLLSMTPKASQDYDGRVMTALTRMLLTLPSQRTSEIGAEAAGEAFMVALDDIPYWATEEAIRLWYRGEHDQDQKAPFDFSWRPSPAVLRKLAKRMEWRIGSRVTDLNKLLGAEAAIEFTDDHCVRMKARVADLGLSTAEPPPKREHDDEDAA